MQINNYLLFNVFFYFNISHMKFSLSLWNVRREEWADEYKAGQEIEIKTHTSTK